MTTNDIDAIRKQWLAQCGPCDAGLAMECSHPDADERPLISALSDEIEQLRESARYYSALVGERNAELDKVRAELADENLRLREQVFAQKPVIDAAQAWAEMCEDGGIAPDDCRKSEDALFDAVESYRLMDMALTSARDEAEVPR